jgi:hypothetical protein
VGIPVVLTIIGVKVSRLCNATSGETWCTCISGPVPGKATKKTTTERSTQPKPSKMVNIFSLDILPIIGLLVQAIPSHISYSL